MTPDTALLLIVTPAAGLAIALASRDPAFLALMLVYSVVLALGGIAAVISSTSLQSGGTPYLAGSDGEGYFEDALILSREGIDNFQELITTNYAGYQIYLALWFSLFGPSLAIGLIANNLLLLLSVLTLYQATRLLTRSRSAALLACVAMMLTTSHIYYSLQLLKEPAIGLAFGLILLAVTVAIKERRSMTRAALMFMAGTAIVMTMRGALLLFVVVLLAYVGSLFLRRKSHVLLLLVGLLVLAAPLAQEFTTYSLDTEFITETVTLNTVISAKLESGEVDAGGVVGRISGAYLDLPFAAKTLLFAIPSLLQLVLPFDFWSTAFLDDHTNAFFARNLNPLWYLFVAVWALFALTRLFQLEDPLLRRLLLSGVTFFAMVAVIYGGAIPRYATPALLFVYPAIGFWWDRARRDAIIRGQARVFFQRYYFIFLVLIPPYLVFSLLRQL